MKIELIPVVEIEYFNSVPTPINGPYWEYCDDWESYANLRLKKAGFKDDFESYSKGSSFYEPQKLSPSNLKKLVIDWFKDYDGSNLDEFYPFCGGYILRVDDEDVFFPQCCGDLGDIIYWKKIVKEKKNYFYNGHPAPLISFSQSEIVFTFDETDEQFVPPVIKRLSINADLLKAAFKEALNKLKEFEKNILRVNNEIKLNLKEEQLIEILIYRNQEIKNQVQQGL